MIYVEATSEIGNTLYKLKLALGDDQKQTKGFVITVCVDNEHYNDKIPVQMNVVNNIFDLKVNFLCC